MQAFILRKTRNKILAAFKKTWREANNRPEAGTSHIIGHCKFIRLPCITSPQTASCPDGCYYKCKYLALLTNDIIGSCALTKIGLDFCSSFTILHDLHTCIRLQTMSFSQLTHHFGKKLEISFEYSFL